MMKPNEITKIHEHTFAVKLDFPNKAILKEILSRDSNYVWGIAHQEIKSEWQDFPTTIFNQTMDGSKVLVRKMSMEFLIETKAAFDLIDSINRSIHFVQLNTPPPPYLNFERMKGKGKYDILIQQLDYYLEIEIPGASDYGFLTSPHRGVLENAVNWLLKQP